MNLSVRDDMHFLVTPCRTDDLPSATNSATMITELYHGVRFCLSFVACSLQYLKCVPCHQSCHCQSSYDNVVWSAKLADLAWKITV